MLIHSVEMLVKIVDGVVCFFLSLLPYTMNGIFFDHQMLVSEIMSVLILSKCSRCWSFVKIDGVVYFFFFLSCCTR